MKNLALELPPNLTLDELQVVLNDRLREIETALEQAGTAAAGLTQEEADRRYLRAAKLAETRREIDLLARQVADLRAEAGPEGEPDLEGVISYYA